MKITKHNKVWFIAALVFSVLSVGTLAQTSQNVTINVPQSLYLDCTASAAINFTIGKAQIEGTQPFQIGTWSCNVDALTQYRLNSTLTTTTTNITNADATDFSTGCVSASGGNSGANAPSCASGTALTGSDPNTRRGTGGNTASTSGADLSGTVSLNISDWDVNALPGSYTGVITYSVTDTTP